MLVFCTCRNLRLCPAIFICWLASESTVRSILHRIWQHEVASNLIHCPLYSSINLPYISWLPHSSAAVPVCCLGLFYTPSMWGFLTYIKHSSNHLHVRNVDKLQPNPYLIINCCKLLSVKIIELYWWYTLVMK